MFATIVWLESAGGIEWKFTAGMKGEHLKKLLLA
jgi:hypothetical protein